MYSKVNWSDTSDICSSKALLEVAKEKSGGGDVLFITYNDSCDSVVDEAIVRYVAREYPQNIAYERLYEEWGKGVNAFIWGKLVSNGIDESYDCLCDYVTMESDDVEKVMDEVLDCEWKEFCERRNLDAHHEDMLDKFVGYVISNGSIGSFGADYSDDKCYEYIVSDNREYNDN